MEKRNALQMAERLGRIAFNKKKLCVPGQDRQFRAMCDSFATLPDSTRAVSTFLLLDAWIRGWNVGRIAATTYRKKMQAHRVNCKLIPKLMRLRDEGAKEFLRKKIWMIQFKYFHIHIDPIHGSVDNR